MCVYADSRCRRIHYIGLFGAGGHEYNRGAAAGLLCVLLYLVLAVMRQTWNGFSHAAFWTVVFLNAGFLIENSYDLLRKVAAVVE
jgi:hypothetical protein